MSRPWRPAPTTSIYDLRWPILLLQLFPYTHFRNLFFFQFFVQLLGWMESVFLVVFWVFFLAFTELYAGGHLQDLAVAPSGKMSPNFARMGIARSENRDALPYPTLQLDENSLLTFFWSPIFFLDSPASSLLAWIYIYTYI